MAEVEKFIDVTREMAELYGVKNNDYGNSFHETYVKLGSISAITRMSDKLNRLISLTTRNKQKVNNESVRDTLIDLASYAVMTIMEIDDMQNESES